MRLVGLTGGIASGKSTAAETLRRLGAAVVDADGLAREVVLPDTQAFAAVVAAFGPAVVAGDGSLDRKALGNIVFCDPEARKRLEKLLHPAIRRLADGRLQELREQGEPAAFYMAPLLFEAGIDARMDEVWVVAVSPETQAQRLMAREGMPREEAERRIACQMALAEKSRRASIVIDNNGSVDELHEQVAARWRELLERI